MKVYKFKSGEVMRYSFVLDGAKHEYWVVSDELRKEITPTRKSRYGNDISSYWRTIYSDKNKARLLERAGIA